MAYVSKTGRRPMERASKSSHSHVINNEEVKRFLEMCDLPKTSDQVELASQYLHPVQYPRHNPIENIVAADGGWRMVPVRKSFPSSTLTFFQFGALWLKAKDLQELQDIPFISTEAIGKLKDLQRHALVFPTKNLPLKGGADMLFTVRKTIYDFFRKNQANSGQEDTFFHTLRWFIFREYDPRGIKTYPLSKCPSCNEKDIQLTLAEFKNDGFSTPCPNCKEQLFLTDVFRFHELVDEELGAGGMISYLANVIEHILLLHIIRWIIGYKSSILGKFFFIKDGPLAFFGQTAYLHKPMRDLFIYLEQHHNLFMAGLEKTGAFVDHAHEIKNRIPKGHVYFLSNHHIYTYILAGDPDNSPPYADTSYYSSKMIFRSRDDKLYVVSIPNKSSEVYRDPKLEDMHNLMEILDMVEKLKCDMYDDALIPVALANKLISLSDHPSSKLLERFAKGQVS